MLGHVTVEKGQAKGKLPRAGFKVLEIFSIYMSFSIFQTVLNSIQI
jgi:hypothetical protein